MSAFDADRSQLDDVVFDEFGDEVSYRLRFSAPVTATAIVDRDVELIDDAGVYIRRTLCSLRRSEMPENWRPETGDEVQIVGAELLRVERLERDDGSVAVLRCSAQRFAR